MGAVGPNIVVAPSVQFAPLLRAAGLSWRDLDKKMPVASEDTPCCPSSSPSYSLFVRVPRLARIHMAMRSSFRWLPTASNDIRRFPLPKLLQMSQFRNFPDRWPIGNAPEFARVAGSRQAIVRRLSVCQCQLSKPLGLQACLPWWSPNTD